MLSAPPAGLVNTESRQRVRRTTSLVWGSWFSSNRDAKPHSRGGSAKAIGILSEVHQKNHGESLFKSTAPISWERAAAIADSVRTNVHGRSEGSWLWYASRANWLVYGITKSKGRPGHKAR